MPRTGSRHAAGRGAELVAAEAGDWGNHGQTMAWCCTERDEGAEAYCGDEQVIDSMADSLTAIAGDEVYVELRRRIR